ncbi:hypothetical protein NQU49_26240, partial [Escherichia coli]|uniref:hypothetical protein n=1 Tax=Escherichia coli TaxID=562 RepID=UPI0021174B02
VFDYLKPVALVSLPLISNSFDFGYRSTRRAIPLLVGQFRGQPRLGRVSALYLKLSSQLGDVLVQALIRHAECAEFLAYSVT